MKHDLKVGQTLWFIPSYGNGRKVVVEKVGRKWAYLSRGSRVDLQTLRVVDRDYCCGQCYLSLSHYEDHAELEKLWKEFRLSIECQFKRPAHVTKDVILQCTELLHKQEEA